MDKLFNAARFGEKLKKYRLKKHLSQMELAEKIDLQTSSASHLENGTPKLTEPLCNCYKWCCQRAVKAKTGERWNAYHIQLLEIEATIKVAEANNYDMMLKKALKEKDALEKIIKKIEKGDRKNDS